METKEKHKCLKCNKELERIFNLNRFLCTNCHSEFWIVNGKLEPTYVKTCGD